MFATSKHGPAEGLEYPEPSPDVDILSRYVPEMLRIDRSRVGESRTIVER